ncbi:uncharacterized protein LOC114288681 isoform X1 [Camellia sinensis]|uniref:uncharacterized protein LOC114288681 isoform X1 n=1 Tax=Camellia sinensis TaxID=4442 RepID=UPI0010361031|nr:uncharacterized protein LOC114288681 isoform X1 [Camellia sinensis]
MRRGRKNRTSSRKPNDASASSNFVPPSQEQICYEGESLAQLIKSIQREMESARLLDTTLPHKIWIKQQFSVGVNDVTRVLERMPPVAVKESSTGHPFTSQSYRSKAPPIQLQAILLASDCNPRWLTRHLPSMASSRKVPLIFVKDKKGGSVRLGELVKLKTAIAIGVKVKGNAINQCIEEILHGNEINFG